MKRNVEENYKEDEICISYDVVGKTLSFYNTATKNRMRYNRSNVVRVVNVLEHIDALRPTIHLPFKSRPIKIFIENIRLLRNDNVDPHMRDEIARKSWDTMWEQLA